MNKTFKIVGINPETNRQQKKRIYTSQEDYLKYKDDLIKRYQTYMNVMCFELIDNKWHLIESQSYSRVSKEIKK
jgi:hypothetical protein